METVLYKKDTAGEQQQHQIESIMDNKYVYEDIDIEDLSSSNIS